MKNINKFLLLTFFAMNPANLQSMVTMVKAYQAADHSTLPVATQDYTVTNKTNVPVIFTYNSWSDAGANNKTKLLAPGEIYTVPLASNIQYNYTITAENMGLTQTSQSGELTATNPDGLQSLNILTRSSLDFQPTNGGSVQQQISSAQDQLQQIKNQFDFYSGLANVDTYVDNLKTNPVQNLSSTQELLNEYSDFLKNIPPFIAKQLTDQINKAQLDMITIQNQIAVTEKLMPTLQPYIDKLNNWTQILFAWEAFPPTINGQSVPQALPEFAPTIDNKNKALAYIQTIPADIVTQFGEVITMIKDRIASFVPGNEFQPFAEAPFAGKPTFPIIINNSNSPATMITITFYDKDYNALNSPTDVWYNGGAIAIPSNVNFVEGTYVALTLYHEAITVLDLITIDPTKSYSLTNPNSKDKPTNSRAKWVLTPITTTKKATSKKTGSRKWKEACKNDRSCRSGNCKNGYCTKS